MLIYSAKLYFFCENDTENTNFFSVSTKKSLLTDIREEGIWKLGEIGLLHQDLMAIDYINLALLHISCIGNLLTAKAVNAHYGIILWTEQLLNA